MSERRKFVIVFLLIMALSLIAWAALIRIGMAINHIP